MGNPSQGSRHSLSYGTCSAYADFWVSVPNSTKGKHKIILTIKAMLKLDLTITTLSKEERRERQLEKLKSEMGKLMKKMADMNSDEIK